MIYCPEPPVLLIERQCSRMVGKDQPTRSVMLNTLATIFGVKIAELWGNKLTQLARSLVLLRTTLVDLICDCQKALRKAVVKAAFQQTD